MQEGCGLSPQNVQRLLPGRADYWWPAEAQIGIGHPEKSRASEGRTYYTENRNRAGESQTTRRAGIAVR